MISEVYFIISRNVEKMTVIAKEKLFFSQKVSENKGGIEDLYPNKSNNKFSL